MRDFFRLTDCSLGHPCCKQVDTIVIAFVHNLRSTTGVIELISATLAGLVAFWMKATLPFIALIMTIGLLVPLCARLYRQSARAARLFGQLDSNVQALHEAYRTIADRQETLASFSTPLMLGVKDLETRSAQLERAVDGLRGSFEDAAGFSVSLAHRVDEVQAALEVGIASLKEVADAQKGEVLAVKGRLTGLDTVTADLSKTATTIRSGLMHIARGDRLPHIFYGIDVFDPELDMLPLLASAIEPRTAIDVGSNRGALTAALRRAGFSVDAFEPLPELAVALGQRFADDPHVRIHAVACSDEIGSAKLHTVNVSDDQHDNTLFSSLTEHPVFSGFEFSGGITVPTTTLDKALADEQRLKVGLLKIDTEGHDLAVLRGATRIDAQVLLVEFWDKEHVFNAGKVRNTLRDYLAAVDRQRYPFHLILWRQSGFDQFGVTIGGMETPQGSWGNIVFSSDEKLVKMLRHWAGETYGTNHVYVVAPLP